MTPPWAAKPCVLSTDFGTSAVATFYGGDDAGRKSIVALDLPDAAAQSLAFMTARTGLHERYVVEEAKTNRLTLMVASLQTAIAALVLVFAPEGREFLSYCMGGGLLVTAVGSVGFRWFKLKAAGVEFESSAESPTSRASSDGGT